MKPILVGESNPYGADPDFALYPAPDGSAGHRLCTLILGMQRKTYLETFERVNLCVGKWSIKEARTRATELFLLDQPLILCGSKVCSAFGITFEPFGVYVSTLNPPRPGIAIIPHPSGLCRLWSTETNAVERARTTITLAIPELASFIIKAGT